MSDIRESYKAEGGAMTETLTEYDRYDLEMIASGLPGHVVSKALRIIDAHQADREALVDMCRSRQENWRSSSESEAAALRAEVERLEERNAQLERELEAMRVADPEELAARLIETKASAAAEVAALRSDLEACKTELRQLDRPNSGKTTSPLVHFLLEADKAKAESAALRAEVERLKAAVDSANRIGEKYQEMFRAERAQLAAANALLDGATDAVDEACYPVWWEQYRAYLAGQSAAPEGEPK